MMKDNEDLVKEEAIEWASRCPAADGDVLEIRQVFEAADFGPEVARQGAALLEALDGRSYGFPRTKWTIKVMTATTRRM
jgi:hypothetical protein